MGRPSWAGSGSCCRSQVAACVAAKTLTTLSSAALSSEALGAVRRRQLGCAARPRRAQIPFFPPFSQAVRGCPGCHAGAAGMRMCLVHPGPCYIGRAGGFPALCHHRPAPRYRVRKTAIIFGPFLLSLFSKESNSGSDSSCSAPKSISRAVRVYMRWVAVGCPHTSLLCWGPAPCYQSRQPHTTNGTSTPNGTSTMIGSSITTGTSIATHGPCFLLHLIRGGSPASLCSFVSI